jgi:hypothetical protein
VDDDDLTIVVQPIQSASDRILAPGASGFQNAIETFQLSIGSNDLLELFFLTFRRDQNHFSHLRSGEPIERVKNQRPSGERDQSLREIAAHSLSFAGRDDDCIDTHVGPQKTKGREMIPPGPCSFIPSTAHQ